MHLALKFNHLAFLYQHITQTDKSFFEENLWIPWYDIHEISCFFEF